MLLSNEHKTRNNTAAIKTLSLSNRHHILLIDDDEIFIFLTRKMLQSLGIVNNISVCRSATEAINYLHQNKGKNVDPDIIFLDLNMPGMDGWEFLEHYQGIVNRLEAVPSLYVVSSSIAMNDAERAMKINGVSGYLSKPLKAEAVRKVIEQTNE